MSQKNIPTPLHCNFDADGHLTDLTIYGAGGEIVGTIGDDMMPQPADISEQIKIRNTNDERARFIVRACNEHAALVRVAEAARNLTADNGQRALDAALANLSAVQANL